VTTIHFASSTTHAKCNHCIALQQVETAQSSFERGQK